MRATALVILLATTRIAVADAPIDLPDTPTEFVLAPTWRALPAATGAGAPIAMFAGPDGIRVAIARASAGNPRAWIRSKRDGFLAEVVTGMAALASGTVAQTRPALAIPALDLGFTRRSPTDVVRLRALFFRTYTLLLTVGGRAAAMRTHAAEVERLRSSFAPPAGWSPS